MSFFKREERKEGNHKGRKEESTKDTKAVLQILNYLIPHTSYLKPDSYLCTMDVKDDLQTRWWNLEAKLVDRFGKKPDLETILFLIGIQEFGDIRSKFTKEQKQDLMHIAVCSLLSQSGYYELEGADRDGWPHFKQLKAMPDMTMIEQENFLKDHVLLYFEQHEF